MTFPSQSVHRICLLIAAACLLLGSPRALLAAEAPEPAAIVKTATPKTIDGDPADWAGAARQQAVTAQDGREVAAFKLAYDAQFLYALIAVTDDSPLKNSSAVLEELIKGGDAISMCFGASAGQGANQRIVVAQVNGKPQLIACRPISSIKRPHTFASPVKQVAMDYVGPVTGATAAFKPVSGGYVAEVALPWKELGLTPDPAAAIPFDLQVMLSDPAGMTNAFCAWWHSAGSDAFATEDLPTEAMLYPQGWGQAKLYAKDPGFATVQAKAARTDGVPITFDLPRAARVSLVVTDDTGWIVRELLRADKMEAGRHTIQWNGRDRYDEALPPGEYRWKLAYFDGMGTKFQGSVGNSARPPYRTADGKGSMGGQHGGPSVIAADSGGIYITGGAEEGHPAMRKIDVDGRTLWKRSMGGFGVGRAVAVDSKHAFLINSNKEGMGLIRLDPATGLDAPLPGKAPRVPLVGDPKRIVGGLAVAGNKAYYSLPAENKLGVVDLTTGQTAPDVAIESPQGLCRVDDGHLLVCTKSQVVTLDIVTGKSTPLISDLSAPRAVTIDTQGRICVSDLGDSQQIKRFSRDGKPLDILGRAGGRAPTVLKYDPMELRNVVGLAIGADQSVWAVESSPLRRVAKFSAEGKWLTDLYGPVAYNVFGPDLDDMSTIYYQASQGTPNYIKARVDYAKYVADPLDPMAAWRVESVFRLTQSGKEESADPDLMAGATTPGYGHIVAFTAANNHRYLWRFAKHNRATSPAGAAIWLWDNERWIPACFITNDPKKGKSWSDTNGDGLVQPDELYEASPTTQFAWLDRDLRLWGWDGTIQPSRTDARGVPFYAGGKFTPYLNPDQPRIEPGHVFNSMPDSQGAVYIAANYGTHRHLSFWDRASENQIVKLKDGREQWLIGLHDAQARHEGDLTTVSGIAGIVGDILIAHTVEPARYIAFTTDGLTLGNVIVDENGQQPRVGPNAIYIESFTGLFLADPKTQKRLLFAVSSGDDRILEVTGPGQIDRLEGTVKLDTPRPRTADIAGKTVIPYETWWGTVGTGYAVDGNDWEWLPHAAGIPIRDGSRIIGDVRLRRDAGALCVLADALSPTNQPARDGASDLQKLWGQTEGVELLIGPDAKGDGQPPAAGNARIFLTVRDGKPVALICRPSEKGTGTVWKPIAGATVALRPRWHGFGWRLEAEIPLDALPQVSQVTEQSFRRGTTLATVHEKRPDLLSRVRFNAALLLQTPGGVQRYPWTPDGNSVTDPRPMDSSKWGIAEATVPLPGD